MLTKRIIPCLDIKNGKTVKGVQFENLRDAGDPVELALHYVRDGADELVFLDISATTEERETLVDLVLEIAAVCTIPFTVGGGINSVHAAKKILRAGADKVAVNSAALENPQLLTELSEAFGTQCIVLAIDARFEMGEWRVYKNGGKKATNWTLFEWAQEGTRLGAGEILFTSMNADGEKGGYALDALKRLSNLVSVPIIASGGAGKMEHFLAVFRIGQADGALAASVFHFGDIQIPTLKNYLKLNQIEIR
jgi:imidazole glycerol-phosphate synthase subunit HisF